MSCGRSGQMRLYDGGMTSVGARWVGSGTGAQESNGGRQLSQNPPRRVLGGLNVIYTKL